MHRSTLFIGKICVDFSGEAETRVVARSTGQKGNTQFGDGIPSNTGIPKQVRVRETITASQP
ncbi:MAG TPA: hypothetical protein VMD58_09900 [Acidobacteriaceae bacterium]|nr:hypothetical protein [Acidobacteriaceae bacterium]